MLLTEQELELRVGMGGIGRSGWGPVGARRAGLTCHTRNPDLSQSSGYMGGFWQVKCRMGDQDGQPACCSAGDRQEGQDQSAARGSLPPVSLLDLLLLGSAQLG